MYLCPHMYGACVDIREQCVGPGVQSQVIKLGSKCLFLMIHLIDSNPPFHIFICYIG